MPFLSAVKELYSNPDNIRIRRKSWNDNFEVSVLFIDCDVMLRCHNTITGEKYHLSNIDFDATDWDIK